MHFLYPAFLFALLTLAIPIIIHLFNFRKYQKVYFSNVQFLKEVKEQQSHRRNLKERLILASRLLALTFLVLAFAKPYIQGRNAINAGKQQAVSIFIDNSYSMQTLNREGALLDEAKRRAKEIASAYGINDSFQLLTQDFEGKHQRLINRDEFNDAVDAVRISPQSRSLQQIINRQQSLLDTRRDAAPSIYILSDFQKNMQSPRIVESNESTRISLIQLKATSLPNVAVDSVILLNAVHRPGESEKLVVRIRNYAGKMAEKIPLKLLINGEQKALGSYSLNARSMQYDTLAFSGLKAGWQRAEIRLQDNPVTFDNQFYFSFNVKQQLPVLLIDGGITNPYLKAVFETDPFFAVKRIADGNVDYGALNNYPLIVLSDISTVSTGLAQQLKSYVNKGGTLVVFPAVASDVNSYRSMLQPMHAAYPEKLLTEEARVAEINLQNPVFKNIFEDFPKSPDLPVVTRYYQLSSSNRSRQEGLMTLPGGRTFFAGYKSGKGKVYVSAVPLNEDFSNLPRHALFVPVVFRIALLSGHDQPLFYTLGRDEVIETLPVQTTEKQLLRMVKGSQQIIPDTRQQEGMTQVYIADQVHETGLYDLKKQDSIAAVLAFNDNRSESDLSYLNDAELARLMPRATKITGANSSSKENIKEINFGVQLWKLCIILALIFLGAEILLIRYYKTDQRSVAQPV